MKFFKKIIAVFSCIAIVTSILTVPAAASDGVSGTFQNIFEWLYGNSPSWENAFFQIIYGDDWMNASEDELRDAYDNYVNDLQTDLGTTTIADVSLVYKFPVNSVSGTGVNVSSSDGVGVTSFSAVFQWKTGSSHTLNVVFDPLTASSAGYYTTGFYGVFDNCELTTTGFRESFSVSNGDEIKLLDSGGFTLKFSPVITSSLCSVSGYAWCSFVPYSGVSSFTTQDVTINSRPASITGDYGIIGDDGTIIKYDSTKIVDETNSLVWNPVTDNSVNFTEWSYDYSDRSYNLTLEDGSTMKVVYGDENVTIVEGDMIYNVYYMLPDSGSGDGGSSGDDDSSGGLGDSIAGLGNALGDILAGLIQAVVNLANKALEALSGLGDLFTQMVETVLGFFGGFIDFLSAMFPFLPEETFTIINLGLILMIAAAVFRKFLK